HGVLLDGQNLLAADAEHAGTDHDADANRRGPTAPGAGKSQSPAKCNKGNRTRGQADGAAQGQRPPSRPAHRLEHVIRQYRHQGDGQDHGRGNGQRLGVRHWIKELDVRTGQGEHGQEGNHRVGHGGEHGAAHFDGGVVDHVGIRALRLQSQPAVDVFRHDDAHVRDIADGDGNAGQGHDVAVDAEPVHDDEADEHGEGQGGHDGQRAAQVQQEQQHDDAHDDGFLGERLGEGVHRFVDDVGAVGNGDDPDGDLVAVGQHDLQPGLDVLDAFLEAADDCKRVLAETHEHDAANGFAAGVVENAAAEVGAELNRGHVLDEDRGAGLLAQDDVLDVGNVLDEAGAADEELEAVLLHDLGADVDVALAHRLVDLGQGDAVGTQLVGINVNLILLDEAAERGDFRHALDRLELIAHVPILQRTQLRQVGAVGLQRVPEDLAQGRGVRPQHRHHLLGKL